MSARKPKFDEITRFLGWLPGKGAEVLAPTNQWELVRFRANGRTSIVYTNAAGRRTFTGEAEKAWTAFKSGHEWRAQAATKPRNSGSVIARTLRKRDGDGCFFCLLPVAIEDESVEHLVPRVHGGPNHLSNFLLAHRRCNADAGHLSALEKIAIHVRAHVHPRDYTHTAIAIPDLEQPIGLAVQS